MINIIEAVDHALVSHLKIPIGGVKKSGNKSETLYGNQLSKWIAALRGRCLTRKETRLLNVGTFAI